VTIEGGQAPYTIGIHPLEGTGKAIKVPDTQVSNGQGSMEYVLDLCASLSLTIGSGFLLRYPPGNRHEVPLSLSLIVLLIHHEVFGHDGRRIWSIIWRNFAVAYFW
jgi:hypothetical protein